MLNVTIDDTKIMQQLAGMPARIRANLYKTVWALALKLQRHIVTDKLQGQVLGHRSGKLWQSIQADAQQTDHSVTGRAFSTGDIKYAAFWEYGGTIPPHIIRPKNGEALRFMMNGKEVFFKQVNHPGYTTAPRSFMRSSLRDMRQEIIDSISRAVVEATAT